MLGKAGRCGASTTTLFDQHQGRVQPRLCGRRTARSRATRKRAYVLALAFDLLDDANPASARPSIWSMTSRARGWHLSTGFIGTKDLMLVLAQDRPQRRGLSAAAQRHVPLVGLLHQALAPPSIWERWDGWTPEKGFQDPGMNSFAHYSFGAVYQWMVENIGGIRSDGPGYRRIIIAPKEGRHRVMGTMFLQLGAGEDIDRMALGISVGR